MCLSLTACTTEPVPGFTRETLPDGREIVSYAAGLPGHEDTLVALFTAAKYVDESSETFGDLRDVEVGADGRIYALDYDASEIVVFDGEGNRVDTIARRGEGPGEISKANGVRFGPDGTLWVNDPGKGMITAFNTDGTERERFLRLAPSYGFRWAGTLDSAGVLWEPGSRYLSGAQSAVGAEGLLESRWRRMFYSLDPVSGLRDSIGLDVTTSRFVVSKRQGGIVSGVPYTGRDRATMDRHHRIWISSPDAYGIVRVNTLGDTTLALRVEEDALPVTEADVARWRSGFAIWEEDSTAIADEVMPYIPTSKPLLASLLTDDVDRLWVGRSVPTGALPRWDVFTPDGEYVTTVRGPVGIPGGLEPVVRRGRIYLLVGGEAGERYIVVAALPVVLAVSR